MAQPLNALLSAALADLTREFEAAAGDESCVVPLKIHANLLRHLTDDIGPRKRGSRSRADVYTSVGPVKIGGRFSGAKATPLPDCRCPRCSPRR